MTMDLAMACIQPPVHGMPIEVWTWLRESMAVRPHVVARVRASLEAGERATPDDIATAMLSGTRREGAPSLFRDLRPAS